MPMRHALVVAIAVALAACAQPQSVVPATGPGILQPPTLAFPASTIGDPVRTSVLWAAAYLADPPSRLAGNPALAAQVAAQYEHATVGLRELRFTGYSPLMQIRMDQGRTALRESLGIAADAPPELVIDQLSQIAVALRRGDAAAAERLASSPVFARPAPEVLATLAAMPRVPAAGIAAGFAESQLSRSDATIFRLF
jgi:hypothetical protein